MPLDQLAAYLNFDMVGRMQDNKLTVQATGTSASWGRLIEQANIAAGFDLLLQQDPYQPTDVASFNQAGVPVSQFLHRHAHRLPPAIGHRRQDRLRRSRSHRRLRRGHRAPRRSISIQPPLFTKVDQQTEIGGGRAGVRVFTGTIPDYSTEVKGLLLERRDRRRSGRSGGPPEGRRHRRDRRADDRQHLRLHLRARSAEDWRAGEGRLHAGRRAEGNDADARRAGSRRSVDRQACRSVVGR